MSIALELFKVVDNETTTNGVKSIDLFGCSAILEYEIKSLQTRAEWAVEVRPTNKGAATFDLARTAGSSGGVMYLAVGTCPAIDLSEQVGPSETKQRELASTILRNLVLYGLTELRVIKHQEVVTAIPILGERDVAPFEDTNDLQVSPPRRFHVYHYAPYDRDENLMQGGSKHTAVKDPAPIKTPKYSKPDKGDVIEWY
ncbi:MAG: hypothetical protein ACYTF7_07500 [Planctomycetota bacterium]|jgi:hypothetical protein